MVAVPLRTGSHNEKASWLAEQASHKSGLHRALPRADLVEAGRGLMPILQPAPCVASARNARTWEALRAMAPMSSSKTAIEVFA